MFCLVGKLAMKFIQDNINYWPTPAESLDMNSIETVNYEVAIIWRFKSICISLLKKAPDHWSLVILITRSISCPLLSQNRVFTIVSTSEVVSTPLRSLNLNQFKKHVKSCDCLSSGVSNYLNVSGITFHSCKLQSVLSWYVFTAQISYVPSTLHICQNLYRTSAFSFVNQKSITLFD